MVRQDRKDHQVLSFPNFGRALISLGILLHVGLWLAVADKTIFPARKPLTTMYYYTPWMDQSKASAVLRSLCVALCNSYILSLSVFDSLLCDTNEKPSF